MRDTGPEEAQMYTQATAQDMRDQVTIRMAGPADEAALRELEQLDAGRLAGGDVLVAEVGGELRAALAVDGGRAVADPFRRTAALVELLGVHAAQLRGSTQGHAHRAGRLLPAAAR